MSRSQTLIRLTSRLIARRDALRKILSEEVNRLRQRPDFLGHGDEADAAVDTAGDEICSRLAEIESRELTEIEETLRRLAQGTYGRCESCGGRIPAMRLNVLPCTTRCIACQRRDEGRGRSRPHRTAGESWSDLDGTSGIYGDDDRRPIDEDFCVRTIRTI
jgi:DnaK suppressor protein